MQGEWPRMDHPETSPLWRTSNYRIIDIAKNSPAIVVTNDTDMAVMLSYH
jgi:predicted nuclease of predicted toxin-antitoxin system